MLSHLKNLFCLILISVSLTSCGAFTPGWEEDYKRQFTESCLVGEGQFHADAKVYCDCALEKTIQRYPDPGDFVNRKDSAAYRDLMRTCP